MASSSLELTKSCREMSGSQRQFRSGVTTEADRQAMRMVYEPRHGHHKVEEQDDSWREKIRPCTLTLLSLVHLLLFDHILLASSDESSEQGSDSIPEQKLDTEADLSLFYILDFLACKKPVAVEKIIEALRRSDERSSKYSILEGPLDTLRSNIDWGTSMDRQQHNGFERWLQSRANNLGTSPARKETKAGEIRRDNQRALTPRLYPDTTPPHQSHPSANDFSVLDQGPIGKALLTHRSWQQGDFMARFDGLTVPEVMLHTLQRSQHIHLLDPYFVGNLAHSCRPNVMLDMAEHEMWAILDIEPGSVLSMDYASTEDRLFRTFQCECSALSCRGEVTGRKECRSKAMEAGERNDDSSGVSDV